jgi:hypothetical protein
VKAAACSSATGKHEEEDTDEFHVRESVDDDETGEETDHSFL